MVTALQPADTFAAPEPTGRHSISPLLLLVLVVAVLWMGALHFRRRRAQTPGPGPGDRKQNR